MINENEKPSCHRADDLLAYLYEEANEAEKRDFARHLDGCAPCHDELTAFQATRADLGAWRNEMLGTAPARSVAEVRPTPSLAAAWAAWREFFALSPLWLRGATAFASLAFVGLMVFALTNAKVAAPTNVATTAPQGATETEIKSRVEAAVNAERAGLTARHAQELEALKAQNAANSQRAEALQVSLKQAQNNVSEPRVITVRVPAATPARSSKRPQIANGNKPRRPALPVSNGGEEETATASLSEVMFGGAGGSR